VRPADGSLGAGRERVLFVVLYFAEGVPIGFLWWALPSVLREQSMDVASITSLAAALTIPWTLKFLVGPVIDRSVERGRRLRDWILACQVAMGLALLPLAVQGVVPAFSVLLALLLVHACFAAVQDVAIDTLCMRTVPLERLGSINGWMHFGMTVGRATAAASVPLLIHSAGWRTVICTMVLLIWLPMIVVLTMVREPAVQPEAAGSEPGHWRRMFGWALLPALGVALLAGTGFEATGALAGPLMVDLRFDVASRAFFFGAIAPAALALGGLVAARLTDRLGLVRAVALGVLTTSLAVAALARSVPGESVAVGEQVHLAWLGLVYLCAGFLISASYACFMSVARGRWSATRFSLLMAMTNACESGSAFVAGRLVPALGYAGALAALAVVSLLSLPFLSRIDPTGARADAEED
jgi:PAT family beta-lactamase induction signal transducer AmpG